MSLLQSTDLNNTTGAMQSFEDLYGESCLSDRKHNANNQ